MEQLKEMRAQSNQFAKILILEIGFCAALYFAFTYFLMLGLYLVYLFILFAVPLAYNIYLYRSAVKKRNAMGRHYAIIAQVLVLLFTCKFLI
jgi:predicted permease